jgi:hypothetical protein
MIARAQGKVDLLETDGRWCPMAHCNRLDDSFHELPPLREVRSLQRIGDARVSPLGFIHLGSFTGERMAVCTYASPRRPALAAFDYQDGRTLWVNPQEDLPGVPRRIPAGILIARVARAGQAPERRVFAANPSEFVAYSEDGRRLWKRPSGEITPAAPGGVGLPISISFTDEGELVAATAKGWVIKLDPIDGRTIDAYCMTTSVAVNGRLYPGVFMTMKSPIVIGNVLYLLAEFKPDPGTRLHASQRPVYVVRVQLTRGSGRDRAITPLARPGGPRDVCPDRALIGVTRGRGSPSALVSRDGSVLVFAHAHRVANGRLWPVMSGVADVGGVLKRRWVSTLEVRPGDSVHSAPALHAGTRTLLVTTYSKMFALAGVDSWSGDVPAPRPLDVTNLFDLAATPHVTRVGFGSPFALTYDAASDEIVAYTNFRAFTAGNRPYGFMGAFAMPMRRRKGPRALWSRPLGFTATGRPISSPGTFGQPALFRYDDGGRRATGLIVNTVYTGTYMLK